MKSLISYEKRLNSNIMTEEKSFCFQNLKTFKSVTQNPTRSSEIQVLIGLLDQAVAHFFPLAWRLWYLRYRSLLGLTQDSSHSLRSKNPEFPWVLRFCQIICYFQIFAQKPQRKSQLPDGLLVTWVVINLSSVVSFVVFWGMWLAHDDRCKSKGTLL